MQASIPRMINLADSLIIEGYQKAVLLGMGGSSLAPEVLRKTFGVKPGYLDLTILDSTDPGTIINIENSLDLEKTLFIVSTKSGTTPETLSSSSIFTIRFPPKWVQKKQVIISLRSLIQEVSWSGSLQNMVSAKYS
jgi:glucose-6-phosphate isomerase